MAHMDWTFLGTVAYEKALQIQYALAGEVAAGADPVLFMLSHPPTVTLGRSADPKNLKLSEEEYADRGIEVFRVRRGGDVTFHGPGQLIGYPLASIRSLGISVPAWVRGFAEVIIAYLRQIGVEARWSADNPGVWVGDEKIAALGFHISRGVSTHGFALNIDPDLSCYETIVPCGIRQHGVTSIARQAVAVPRMEDAAAELAIITAREFGFGRGRQLPASTFVGPAGISPPDSAGTWKTRDVHP